MRSVTRGQVALLVAVLLSAGLVASSGRPVETAPLPAGPDPPVAASTSTVRPVPRPTPRELVADAEAAVAPSTELAVAVLDLATGESAVGRRGEQPVQTASLIKMVVAVDVVQRAASGDVALRDDDPDLIRAALGPSDDAAMNQLWVRYDGPASVTRTAQRWGLAGVRPPEDPSQWGESITTAIDHARLWAHLLRGSDGAGTDGAGSAFVLDALRDPPAIAADGFAQDFGLLAADPANRGSVTAAKQGWMCCPDGRRHLHTSGIVERHDRTMAVVLLTTVERSVSWEAARGQLDLAAAAVINRM